MSKKIKILYLTTSAKMLGAEKMFYELAAGINRKEFEILVCTIKDKDKDLLLKLKNKGIKTKTLGLNEKWQFLKVLKLVIIIKQFKPNIIQSFLFFDNILARIFGAILNVPIIISGQRNVETNRSSLRNFIDKTTLPLADLIVSNTEAGRSILMEREKVLSKKIMVIPNGIDLRQIPSLPGDEEKKLSLKAILSNIGYRPPFVVGYVGYLTKQKGVNILLESFDRLKRETKNKVVLFIVGDGPEKRTLEKLAKKLNINDSVFFLGYKKNAIKFMTLFDLFILPSLWEGQPNVILEAMALGLPVIATNVGGVPEMIQNKENGFLVKPNDSEALTKAIEFLVNSEPDRKKISDKAARSVKKYSIENMVIKFEDSYRQLTRIH